MATQESTEYYQSSVEVIREELRQSVKTEQKNQRYAEVNKRRTALGELTYNEESWNADDLVLKAKELRRKPLSIDDYIKLQNTLIQDEANIKLFLSINHIISALIRDLCSSNPAIQLSAAHCFCNIALGNKSCCSTLSKYAGPYLIEQLDTLSNPLLEVIAWTVGNLCSGSKNACKALYAQGCLCRLLSLLRDCDTMILPSVIYAITHCILGGPELISNEESVEIINTLINRNCFDSTAGLWILALLSSNPICLRSYDTIIERIFDILMKEMDEQSYDTKRITAIVRLFANLISESSGSIADIILYNLKYKTTDVQEIFNKLLIYPHVHVRKETLWLIGNFYNHSQPRINHRIKELLSYLTNIQLAIQSVQL
ncbi:uncharacterized protein [Chelonus insularis]|uniref:uncharacterized protein n=1 Tax=Chelonus insularis TaxID=460826 RepID=UPI00158BA44D|nr:uncharacterized protein LOC118073909 [Chelonus insularis]XP_034950597.1 uncharacterized protein LOC118073909 [Chelonus insularis]